MPPKRAMRRIRPNGLDGRSGGGVGGVLYKVWIGTMWYVPIPLTESEFRGLLMIQTELPHVPLVVLITSTHGRGDPPPTMLPLWTALLRKSLPPDILEGTLPFPYIMSHQS